MSDIRFRTFGEARWWVAYMRFLAGERPSRPRGNHDTYGNIPPGREAVLAEDAQSLLEVGAARLNDRLRQPRVQGEREATAQHATRAGRRTR